MITETRARYDGVSTRVLSVAGGGTPIVLLHGFADSVETWEAATIPERPHPAIKAEIDASIGAANAKLARVEQINLPH
jgi:pimeloyl-ACP methyl ester carboxylesterase